MSKKNTDNQSLINKYIQLREYLGLTQESLAMHLDLTRGAIQSWERGETAPQAPVKRRLMELCHDKGIVLTPMFYNYQVGGVRFLSDIMKNERKRKRHREALYEKYGRPHDQTQPRTKVPE